MSTLGQGKHPFGSSHIRSGIQFYQNLSYVDAGESYSEIIRLFFFGDPQNYNETVSFSVLTADQFADQVHFDQQENYSITALDDILSVVYFDNNISDAVSLADALSEYNSLNLSISDAVSVDQTFITNMIAGNNIIESITVLDQYENNLTMLATINMTILPSFNIDRGIFEIFDLLGQVKSAIILKGKVKDKINLIVKVRARD